jgi:hypothetical protein
MSEGSRVFYCVASEIAEGEAIAKANACLEEPSPISNEKNT